MPLHYPIYSYAKVTDLFYDQVKDLLRELDDEVCEVDFWLNHGHLRDLIINIKGDAHRSFLCETPYMLDVGFCLSKNDAEMMVNQFIEFVFRELATYVKDKNEFKADTLKKFGALACHAIPYPEETALADRMYQIDRNTFGKTNLQSNADKDQIKRDLLALAANNGNFFKPLLAQEDDNLLQVIRRYYYDDKAFVFAIFETLLNNSAVPLDGSFDVLSYLLSWVRYSSPHSDRPIQDEALSNLVSRLFELGYQPTANEINEIDENQTPNDLMATLNTHLVVPCRDLDALFSKRVGELLRHLGKESYEIRVVWMGRKDLIVDIGENKWIHSLKEPYMDDVGYCLTAMEARSEARKFIQFVFDNFSMYVADKDKFETETLEKLNELTRPIPCPQETRLAARLYQNTKKSYEINKPEDLAERKQIRNDLLDLANGNGDFFQSLATFNHQSLLDIVQRHDGSSMHYQIFEALLDKQKISLDGSFSAVQSLIWYQFSFSDEQETSLIRIFKKLFEQHYMLTPKDIEEINQRIEEMNKPLPRSLLSAVLSESLLTILRPHLPIPTASNPFRLMPPPFSGKTTDGENHRSCYQPPS